MAIVSMKALLEAAVHFGHRAPGNEALYLHRNQQHPYHRPAENGQSPRPGTVRDTVAEGGMVLFVGTKRQAQETIQQEAMVVTSTTRWVYAHQLAHDPAHQRAGKVGAHARPG